MLTCIRFERCDRERDGRELRHTEKTSLGIRNLKALLLLLCVLLAACRVGLGHPDELRDKPEATLAPPGTEFQSDGGKDAAAGIEGPTDARWSTTFSVDLDPLAIRDWYAEELAAVGWSAHEINLTTSLPSTSWCREGEDYGLRLQFRELDFDPPTRYSWFVQARDPERACTETPLSSFGPRP